ncbi:MAG: hypothetical protein ACJ71Z_10650 [Aeromicrobium sp.]
MKFMVPLFVVCALGLLPSAAWAANELGLSSDGSHWAPKLNTPLFDANFRWVPGDTETASFWVRNQSGDKATLDVAVLGNGIDSLMGTGDLAVTVKAANGSGTTTASVGRQELIASRVEQPGQVERIDVTVAFDRASPNQSQLKAFDLQFEVRLTQGSASGGGRDSDNSDDSDKSDDSDQQKVRDGMLPGTGGPVWWLLPTGMLGVAAGWLTVASSWRKEARDV